jgi:hypothetical protein
LPPRTLERNGISGAQTTTEPTSQYTDMAATSG